MMLTVCESLQKSAIYWTRDFWLEHADKRVLDHWATKNGLISALTLIVLYLSLVQILLPHWMQKRPAMSLKPVLIAYNTFMSLVNFALFLWFLVLSRGGRELFNLVAPSESDTSAQQMSMIRFTELFLVTKFLDLLDTVFIVLRKKGGQKNFLHLYHHSIVPIVLSVSFMLYPTGMTLGIFAFVNTFTHSVMFAYYGCAAIGPSMRPYLWWKRYITQLQIIQFFIFIFFAIAYGTISTGYSMAYVWIGISQSPLFAFLFIRFYLQSYKQNNVLTEDRLKVK